MEPLRPADPRTAGPYRLERRLGGGGMGQVFLGRSPGGRPVAVKVVRPELAGDAGFRRRFAREVEAARKVGGFHTAQVVDADPRADPPWLVTAFVPGPSLYQAVVGHGPLPAPALDALGAGLAEGLAAIHGAGLVHRDLKPGNIILAADGPRVIDFGIARALDAAHHSTVVAGTPGFMSPEQARGLRVGPPGDVFALGAVLTFAATGRGPFGTGPADALLYRAAHGLPDLSGLPPHLADLVGACLDRDPDRRPALAEILDRLAAPGGAWLPPAITTVIDAHARELASGASTRRWGRRGFVVAGLGAAAAVPAALLLRSSLADGGEPGGGPRGVRRAGALRFGAPVTLQDGGAAVRSVAFGPDGAVLAAAGEDGATRLWNVGSRTLAAKFTHRAVNPWSKPLAEVTAFNPLFRAALSTSFSPDGARLAVGNGDGTISVWNVADGAETTLPYLDRALWNRAIGCAVISPAGRTLAAAYDAPAFRLWDLDAGASAATVATGDDFWIAALAFSPSGGLLATASGNTSSGNTAGDGRLQLWDTASSTNVATLAHANSGAHSLAFGHDGRTLAHLRTDGRVTLWNVAARTATATLTGAGSGATCMVSGPNGILAGGFGDGTVTLWDIAARRAVTVLRTGSGSGIDCVAISPDGRTVAAAGAGRLTLWPAL
ncbi:WD40 repeat domain-containing serine/threonine protein kinase [Actinomadura kijaniata]|uniref:WD40 repeat domain-containing serine/threonine protein kinase n=1 Tax=Actinomadura kijaniata TaxID=46161 RepID=UPI003F1BD469